MAAMMEYVNLLRDEGETSRPAIEPLLVMLAPYAPHLAEELWAALGRTGSIFSARWPAFDERLAAAGDVQVVVQVNGHARGRVTVCRGASQAQVVQLALKYQPLQKFLA